MIRLLPSDSFLLPGRESSGLPMTRSETDPMRHLLILNPNTDTSLTQKLAVRARVLLPGNTSISSTTACLGASYIACRASLAIAAHATLDAFAREYERNPALAQPDTTVLIACFGDPGLAALQEITQCSVTGMAQASLQSCRNKGGRTGIITGGDAWKPLIEELVATTNFGPTIAGIRTLPESGEHASKSLEKTVQALQENALDLIHHDHADHILVAGAGLAGLDQVLSSRIPVPVYCSFAESIAYIAASSFGHKVTKQAPLTTTGLSVPLSQFLQHPII